MASSSTSSSHNSAPAPPPPTPCNRNCSENSRNFNNDVDHDALAGFLDQLLLDQKTPVLSLNTKYKNRADGKDGEGNTDESTMHKV